MLTESQFQREMRRAQAMAHTESQFQREMRRAQAMAHVEGSDSQRACYWEGYQRGLRRAYHGAKFGTVAEHRQWLKLADEPHDEQRRERGNGYRDGFSFQPARPGRPTDETRKSYQVTLRPSVVAQVEAAEPEMSRSAAIERLILEALAARRGWRSAPGASGR